MTASPSAATSGAASGSRRPATALPGCLARLDEAIGAARTLGVPVDAAESVRAEADARLGLSADVYVIGLVGGTGVGKSSLLNALAGRTVSPASVVRPTTAAPVAWVPSSSAAAAGPLLERLGVTQIVEHVEVPGTEALIVLDLPDLDSVDARHRETVEALLPRLDAVAWVTDPEKYHDAVLHDAFLRQWLPRLDRQAILVNKSDRLRRDDAERVRQDLRRDLRSERGHPAQVPVILSTTIEGPTGLEELRGWLEQGIEAKAVIAARLAAAAASAVDELAAVAGIDPVSAARPLLTGPERRAAVDRATAEVLRLVDLPGLERQAVAATRARARSRGAGPIGWLTSLLYRWSGRERAAADPVGYLRRWRDRGSPILAAEALRDAAADSLRAAAPAVRPTLAAATDAGRLDQRLTTAVDAVVAAHAEARAPSSRLWPLLGLLQTAATLLIAFAAAWLVIWILLRPPVASLEVPALGPIPMPFALLVVGIVAGFIVARLLGWHAGWLGRGWARRLRGAVHDAIEASVAEDAYAPLDRLEQARRALWIAARGTGDCRGH